MAEVEPHETVGVVEPVWGEGGDLVPGERETVEVVKSRESVGGDHLHLIIVEQ